MNSFQKAQAAKILSMYNNVEEILNDIEKAAPAGTINKYGKEKQADGSWKYVGKNKANKATPESAGEAKPKKTQPQVAKKIQGVDPKSFVESIKNDRADGKFPLGFIKIDNPSSPLHGQYFKVASVGQLGTVIYAGGKKVKLTDDDKISDRLTATNILNKEKEAGVQKQQETQNKNKPADIKKLDKYGEKRATPAKPSKPAAPKKITKFTTDNVEGELRRVLKSGMKITDVDIDNDGKSFRAYIDTGVRGPRTDHGGGSDGDDWMDSEQVAELYKVYAKPLESYLKTIEGSLDKRFKGSLNTSVDYGEKGHVGLHFRGKLD